MTIINANRNNTSLTRPWPKQDLFQSYLFVLYLVFYGKSLYLNDYANMSAVYLFLLTFNYEVMTGLFQASVDSIKLLLKLCNCIFFHTQVLLLRVTKLWCHGTQLHIRLYKTSITWLRFVFCSRTINGQLIPAISAFSVHFVGKIGRSADSPLSRLAISNQLICAWQPWTSIIY